MPRYLATIATATVAVTAGAAGVVLMKHRTLGPGEPAPRVVPGSKNLYSQKIVMGGRLPADTAFVDATPHLPPVKRFTITKLRMTCPREHVGVAFVPREGDGREPGFYGGGVVKPGQLDHSRFVDFHVNTRRTSPPQTTTVRYGLLCERPPLGKRRSIDDLVPPP